MGTVPDFVTLTLQFSSADTTVVANRRLEIWDKNAIDTDTAPYNAQPLVSEQLANSVNRYEYDTEADKLLEIRFWDVANAGAVNSETVVMTIPVNKATDLARPMTPTVNLVMVEDVSAESSYSVDLYMSSSSSSTSSSSTSSSNSSSTSSSSNSSSSSSSNSSSSESSST
jgi:hypothetical protein